MGKKTPHARLLAWRLGNKLSLTAAALKLGCSRAWLSYIERGERTPGTLDLARRIQSVVGIEVSEWPSKKRARRSELREGRGGVTAA